MGTTYSTRLKPGRPFPPRSRFPWPYFISGTIALAARKTSPTFATPAASALLPRAISATKISPVSVFSSKEMPSGGCTVVCTHRVDADSTRILATAMLSGGSSSTTTSLTTLPSPRTVRRSSSSSAVRGGVRAASSADNPGTSLSKALSVSSRSDDAGRRLR